MTIHDNCVGCAPVMRERDVPASLELSRRKARQLIDEGVLHRVRRGVVVGSCLMRSAHTDGRLRHSIAIRSLLLAYDDAVASHESAALLLGLPVLSLPPYAVATRERGAWRGGPDGRIRIAPLPAHHLAAGQPACTNAPRTFVDIAKSGTLREAVVMGDALVRDHITPTKVAAVLEDCADWADVGKARTALSFLDARSESPLESVSRVIMHEHKLPPPELQVVIDTGPASYRTDFYWKRHGLVGEADGLAKYVEAADLRAEKVRQERLERLGLRVVRWTWRDLLVDTDETIARIRAYLRRSSPP